MLHSVVLCHLLFFCQNKAIPFLFLSPLPISWDVKQVSVPGRREHSSQMAFTHIMHEEASSVNSTAGSVCIYETSCRLKVKCHAARLLPAETVCACVTNTGTESCHDVTSRSGQARHEPPTCKSDQIFLFLEGEWLAADVRMHLTHFKPLTVNLLGAAALQP